MQLEILSKTELAKIFIDNTPVAYIILDKDYRIHYINKSFAILRNLDMETTLGDRCYNISNGGVRCPNCAVAEALATGKKAFVSRKDILPDGSVRFIDDYAIPLQMDDGGEVEYVLEIMINRTQEMLARETRNRDYDEILAILTTLLEAKDSYTAQHSDNVRRLSLNLARAMNLPPDKVFEITVAASLHDIGKVHTPDIIINKPGKLTAEEFSVMQKHPVESSRMLEGLSSFEVIKEIALHHHERVDGTGYPDGLSGEEIPLGAKIVAVADTYDAITTTRSYRAAMPHEYALEEIQRAAGTQLDKAVADVFAQMDFEALSDALYGTEEQTQQKPVERVLVQKTGPQDKAPQPLRKKINQDQLLQEIFRNTPYGYILMDKNRKVLFASDYFLDYMGLEEAQVLGNVCYEAGGIGSKPCENCSIERALHSGKTEYMRQEQFTGKGRKIFDLYGVPLVEADGSIEYVIEIVMDRTEEALFERARAQDFERLIDMLGEVYEQESGQLAEKKLFDEAKALRKRLNELLAQKNPS